MSEFKFSKNLNDYLLSNNLSLSEFSRQIEFPVSTLHGWVNGVEPKSIRDLKKVATYLNLSIDELCFGEGKSYLETDVDITIGNDTFRVYICKKPK